MKGIHWGVSAGLHALVLGLLLIVPPRKPLTLGLPMTVSLLAAEVGQESNRESKQKVTPSTSQTVVKTKKAPDSKVASKKNAVSKATAKPTTAVASKGATQVNPSTQTASAVRYDTAYLNNPPPQYPPLSRRLGEEGTVMLRAQISADGKPLTVQIKQSSGFARLDEAARQAALRWQFEPARSGDTALASWVSIPVRFNLQDAQ